MAQYIKGSFTLCNKNSAMLSILCDYSNMERDKYSALLYALPKHAQRPTNPKLFPFIMPLSHTQEVTSRDSKEKRERERGSNNNEKESTFCVHSTATTLHLECIITIGIFFLFNSVCSYCSTYMFVCMCTHKYYSTVVLSTPTHYYSSLCVVASSSLTSLKDQKCCSIQTVNDKTKTKCSTAAIKINKNCTPIALMVIYSNVFD